MDSREYTKRLIKETNTRLGNQIGDLELRSHIGKKLDVGAFTISAPITSTSVDTVLPLDTISYGNLTLSDNGGIILAPYKRYRITAFSILNNTITGTYNVVLRMKNVTDGTYLPFMTNTARGSSNCENVIETTKTTEIQIVNNSGTSTTINNLYVVVQEIGREVILDPAENAKNLEFEHGTATYYSATSLAINTKIPYDSHVGNININDDGNIVLKANKTYRITLRNIYSRISSTGGYSLYLKNIDNFSVGCIPVTFSTSNQGNSQSDSTEIAVGNTDILIYPYFNVATVLGKVSVEIEEIAHPYYFNYFKDSIGSQVLFDGNANAIGTYTLNDNISHYEYLDVLVNLNLSTGIKNAQNIVIRVYPKYISYGLSNAYLANFSSTADRRLFFLFTDETNFKIDSIIKDSAVSSIQITGVIGWGFNYDNPYKDLISSGSSSIETTEEEMNNLTSF